MLLELLSQSNYQSYNVKLAHLLGLEVAVYLNALIEINEKAIRKDKVTETDFFNLDRDYITARTTFTKAEQHKFDKVLEESGLIEYHSKDSKDCLKVCLTCLLALVNTTEESVETALDKLKKSAGKLSKAEYQLIGVKKNINENYPDELKDAYAEWLNAVMEKHGYINKKLLFNAEEIVDSVTNHDLDKALDIVNIATANAWKDMNFAVNRYNATRVAQPHSTVVENKNVAVRKDVEF